MEAKYYTPTKEEIYNSPELHFLQDNQIQDEIKINPFIYRKGETIIDVQKESDFSNVKIKYLDSEDIESLGWRKEGDEWRIATLKQVIALSYYNEDKTQMVIEDSNTGVSYFIGYIKNKSELRKIMQMIGVI